LFWGVVGGWGGGGGGFLSFLGGGIESCGSGPAGKNAIGRRQEKGVPPGFSLHLDEFKAKAQSN